MSDLIERVEASIANGRVPTDEAKELVTALRDKDERIEAARIFIDAGRIAEAAAVLRGEG
jgi:hypothetical protein